MTNTRMQRIITRSIGLVCGLSVTVLGMSCASTSENPSPGAGYIDAAASERHLAEARQAELAGDLDGMVASLEAAIRSNPYEGRAHYNLGVIQLRAGRLKAAAERFDQASMLMPEKAEPLIGLGAVWLQARQLDEASEAFRRAIEIDPANQWARAGLVMAMDRSAMSLDSQQRTDQHSP